jgi:DNA-binding MarR family transcriptional regulator
MICSVVIEAREASGGRRMQIADDVKATDNHSIPLPIFLTSHEIDVIRVISSRIQSSRVAPTPEPTDQLLLSKIASNIYRTRRQRVFFFESDLFAEPAWDMLLAAYCFGDVGERITVSGLCHASSCPPTTALRWERLLERLNLLERFPSASDGRMYYVRLTDSARNQMDLYLTRVCTQFFGEDA